MAFQYKGNLNSDLIDSQLPKITPPMSRQKIEQMSSKPLKENFETSIAEEIKCYKNRIFANIKSRAKTHELLTAETKEYGICIISSMELVNSFMECFTCLPSQYSSYPSPHAALIHETSNDDLG